MEITKIVYRQSLRDGNIVIKDHSGFYSVVEGGVVLIHSKASQTFIPYSQIERIEQSIVGGDMTPGEAMEKSLVSRHRRR